MMSRGNGRQILCVPVLVIYKMNSMFTVQHHLDITNQEHGQSIIKKYFHFLPVLGVINAYLKEGEGPSILSQCTSSINGPLTLGAVCLILTIGVLCYNYHN